MSPVMVPPSRLALFVRLIPRLRIQQIRSLGAVKIALRPGDVAEQEFLPVHPNRLDRWNWLNEVLGSSKDRMKRFTSVSSELDAIEEIFRPVWMRDDERVKQITTAPDEVFQRVKAAVNKTFSLTGCPLDMAEIERGRLIMRIVEETASSLSFVHSRERRHLRGHRLFCEGRGDVVLTDSRSGAAPVVIMQVAGRRDCQHNVTYRSLLGAEVLADRQGLSTVFGIGTNLRWWGFFRIGDSRVDMMRDCYLGPTPRDNPYHHCIPWLVEESSLRALVDLLYTVMLTPTDFYKPPDHHSDTRHAAN